MAYIVNTTRTAQASGANYTVELGPHAAGDLLLVALTNDVGTTSITPPSGWSILGTQAANGGIRHVLAWKIAASSAETNPQFSGQNDDWVGAALVIRDAHPTDPFGTTPTSGTDFIKTNFSTGNTQSSGSLTTTTDGCLLIYSFGMDGSGTNVYVRTKLSEAICADKVQSFDLIQSVAYVQQESAGAAPTVNWLETVANKGGTHWVVAVRNKTGGALQPTVKADVTDLKYYGLFGQQFDGTVTWEAASAFAASINSITCSSTAPTVTASAVIGTLSLRWGTYTGLSSTESTAGAIVGGSHTISSTDMSGKVFGIQWLRNCNPTDSMSGSEGTLIGFSDGTNWVVYQIASKSNGWIFTLDDAAFIALGVATPYASSGTINWSAITRLAYLRHRVGSITTGDGLYVQNAVLFGSSAIIGGGSSRPSTFVDYQSAMVSWNGLKWAEIQGSAQVLAKSSVQIGDGTNTTYFDSSASSLEYPKAYSLTPVANWNQRWNATDNALTVSIKGGSSDSINLSAGVVASETNQPFTINAASSTSGEYSFSGLSMVGFDPTWKAGIPCDSMTFSGCGIADLKSSDVSKLIFKSGLDNCFALAEDGASFTDSVFTAGGSTIYGIRIAAAGTVTISGCTFTGLTKDFDVTATTGTVTIVKDATDPTPTYQTAGATVVISSPTVERGLAFSGLVAGSTLKVFDTGTTTEQFSDTSTSTTETWSEAVAGSRVVDYTILKDGYIPIRVTGVTVTGAVSGGILPVTVQQVPDRAYVASTGLTFGTTATVNTGTKEFAVSTETTVQNWYACMVESWRTQSALKNVAFPISSNGPNSFQLSDDWVFTSGSIQYLSRDGMRTVNSSGTVTGVWAAILSVGVPAGMQVRYQQQDGSGTTNAANTGNMDQLVKVFEDGAFDYRGHLILKVQDDGYDQAEFDLVGTFGSLEDQFYVAGLAPVANGIAAGTVTGVTITDHGASPVTWNSKTFSITITDTTGHTGEEILQYVRGLNDFNFHDLVQTNGTEFKTVRGKLYGDTGATLKGVRVVQADGTTSHADFNLHTADDGTTYVPPLPPAAAEAVVLADTRVVLYNTTQDIEIDNAFVTGTAYSYVISTEADAGDILTLFAFKEGYAEASSQMIWSGVAQSFVLSQSVDPVIQTFRTEDSITDYTTITEFNAYAPSIYIQADDLDGVTKVSRLATYYNGLLTTEDGARYFRGGMTMLSTAAVRINKSTIGLLIENVSTTLGLMFSDEATRRLFTDDQTSFIAPPSLAGSIQYAYLGVPDVVETGVSGLTGPESAQLMALPSSSAIVSAVSAAVIPVDMVKVKGQTISGSGSEADPWGP